MINLKPFDSLNVNETSLWKNIPVQYRNVVLATLRELSKKSGRKYRLLYRGPRRTAPGDRRSHYSKQSGCLMAHANRFSVYVDTRKVR